MGDTGRDAQAAAVLRLAGEQALSAGHLFLDPDSLTAAAGLTDLRPDEVFRALQSLQAERLVDLHFVPPGRVTLLRLTGAGARIYLQAVGLDLADLRRRMLCILQDGTVPWQGGDAVDLAGATALPSLVLAVVLEDLRAAGQVVFSSAAGRRVRVHKLHPTVEGEPTTRPA